MFSRVEVVNCHNLHAGAGVDSASQRSSQDDEWHLGRDKRTDVVAKEDPRPILARAQVPVHVRPDDGVGNLADKVFDAGC
ncbi:MAG: hypothetical protein QOD07_798 [Frankiaceae bacterium]|nr:hypothetical protein [Frankiaceae bacterium]